MGNFVSHIQTHFHSADTRFIAALPGAAVPQTRTHTHTPTQYSEKPEYMTQLQVCIWLAAAGTCKSGLEARITEHILYSSRKLLVQRKL